MSGPAGTDWSSGLALSCAMNESGTPYFCFKDLDENKPSGSIKIRVETIDYFLRRYRDEVIRKRKAEEEIEAQLAELETRLLQEKLGHDAHVPTATWQAEPESIGAD